MRRALLGGALLLALTALPTLAQTLTPVPPTSQSTTTVQVGHGGWPVQLPNDEPLVVWAGETVVTPAGQFANVSVFVQTGDGAWVQMTPCDNAMMTCQPVAMRIEDVHQGEMFYLSEESH